MAHPPLLRGWLGKFSWLCREKFQAPFRSFPCPGAPASLQHYAQDGRWQVRGLRGAPGAAQIEVSDLRKRRPEIFLFICAAGRADEASAGIPPLWPGLGLMFSPIREMSTAGLRRWGQR